MRKRTVRGRLAWLLVLGVVVGGCIITHGPLPCDPAQEIPLEPYQGSDRPPLQVVEIHIPRKDLDHYPELASKQVGLGLGSRLLEILFQTQRFDLLEAEPEILRAIMDQWEWTRDGVVITIPPPRLKPAAFLGYAKIFDFVVCSPLDDAKLLHKRLTCVTSVGVQVRLVKMMSRQLILGSSDARRPGSTYCHTISGPIWWPDGAFAQSAVGKATDKAMRYAVGQLLQRFEKAGWSGEPTP